MTLQQWTGELSSLHLQNRKQYPNASWHSINFQYYYNAGFTAVQTLSAEEVKQKTFNQKYPCRKMLNGKTSREI